jgi:hypothetical protein
MLIQSIFLQCLPSEDLELAQCHNRSPPRQWEAVWGEGRRRTITHEQSFLPTDDGHDRGVQSAQEHITFLAFDVELSESSKKSSTHKFIIFREGKKDQREKINLGKWSNLEESLPSTDQLNNRTAPAASTGLHWLHHEEPGCWASEWADQRDHLLYSLSAQALSYVFLDRDSLDILQCHIGP